MTVLVLLIPKSEGGADVEQGVEEIMALPHTLVVLGMKFKGHLGLHSYQTYLHFCAMQPFYALSDSYLGRRASDGGANIQLFSQHFQRLTYDSQHGSCEGLHLNQVY